MTVEDFAERLGVGRGTVMRLERGEAGISIGTLTMSLLVLGELERIADLMDAAQDDAGLLLDREHLPQRIRRPSAARTQPEDPTHNDPSEPVGF